MAYLPDTVPAPVLDETNAPFWENCRAQRLAFQQCGDCHAVVHPPLPVCPRCQSAARHWLEAPSRARVYSFIWAHTAAHDSVRASLPYNVVLVEFPDLPGVRLVSNVVDARIGELAIGAAVRLQWEAAPGGLWLPRFRLDAG